MTPEKVCKLPTTTGIGLEDDDGAAEAETATEAEMETAAELGAAELGVAAGAADEVDRAAAADDDEEYE